METTKQNEVLTVHREKKSTYSMVTTLKDSQGFTKAVLTGYNQPTKRKPFITLRGQMYNLKFEN